MIKNVHFNVDIYKVDIKYIKCLPFYYVRRYVMTKKNMLLTMLMVVINNWLLNMVLTMGLMITVKNKNDKVSKGGC